METKDLDIVYFVKESFINEELRYSLRSVCKNMPHKRVWIFGGCPKGIIPDVYWKVSQKGETKWDRVKNMFLMACQNKEITDDFILFNDDFFVMKPVSKIDPWYRSTMEEHIGVLGAGSYKDLLKNVSKKLGPDAKSYELHTPFIFNKKKLLDLIKSSPEMHCTRTMYGNKYDIGGTQHHDIKAFDSRPAFKYKEEEFLSTDDGVVNTNNDVWRYVKRTFSDKCEFER